MTPSITSDFLFVAFIPLIVVITAIEWAFKWYVTHGQDLEA